MNIFDILKMITGKPQENIETRGKRLQFMMNFIQAEKGERTLRKLNVGVGLHSTAAKGLLSTLNNVINPEINPEINTLLFTEIGVLCNSLTQKLTQKLTQTGGCELINPEINPEKVNKAGSLQDSVTQQLTQNPAKTQLPLNFGDLQAENGTRQSPSYSLSTKDSPEGKEDLGEEEKKDKGIKKASTSSKPKKSKWEHGFQPRKVYEMWVEKIHERDGDVTGDVFIAECKKAYEDKHRYRAGKDKDGNDIWKSKSFHNWMNEQFYIVHQDMLKLNTDCQAFLDNWASGKEFPTSVANWTPKTMFEYKSKNYPKHPKPAKPKKMVIDDHMPTIAWKLKGDDE